jgi:hypothetical protein
MIRICQEGNLQNPHTALQTKSEGLYVDFEEIYFSLSAIATDLHCETVAQ